MFKSTERLKLETVLSSAVTPAEILAASAALDKLEARENRRRSRRRRTKAVVWGEVAKLETRKPDMDAVFEIDLTPSKIVAPEVRRLDMASPKDRVVPADELSSATRPQDVSGDIPAPPASQTSLVGQPDAKKPALERQKTVLPPSGIGQTYTRASFGPPWMADSPSCGPEVPNRGTERVISNLWCEADGFSFVARDEFDRPYMTNEREARERNER